MAFDGADWIFQSVWLFWEHFSCCNTIDTVATQGFIEGFAKTASGTILDTHSHGPRKLVNWAQDSCNCCCDLEQDAWAWEAVVVYALFSINKAGIPLRLPAAAVVHSDLRQHFNAHTACPSCDMPANPPKLDYLLMPGQGDMVQALNDLVVGQFPPPKWTALPPVLFKVDTYQVVHKAGEKRPGKLLSDSSGYEKAMPHIPGPEEFPPAC
jgi:hypothetical protein